MSEYILHGLVSLTGLLLAGNVFFIRGVFKKVDQLVNDQGEMKTTMAVMAANLGATIQQAKEVPSMKTDIKLLKHKFAELHERLASR